MSAAMHTLIHASHTIAKSEAVLSSFASGGKVVVLCGVGILLIAAFGLAAGKSFGVDGRVVWTAAIIGSACIIVGGVFFAPGKAQWAQFHKSEQAHFFACAKGSHALSSIDAAKVKAPDRSAFYKAQKVVWDDCPSAQGS